MKKTIFTRFAAATLILAATACQKAEFEGGDASGSSSENLVPMTITASLEAGTKAALQEGGKVFWEKGDSMTVLSVANVEGAETVNSYAFGTSEEGEKVEFTNQKGVLLADSYYAVYPAVHKEYCPYMFYQYYDSKGNYVGITGFEHTYKDGSIQMFLPSTQFASEGAASLDALCAGIVKTDDEDTSLHMKNVGGLIAVTLPDLGITSVTLYGNANEQIAGVVTATFDEDGIPVVSSVEGSNMIRIVPKTKGTFTAGTYYINVPPMTFESGLTLVFTDNESRYATLKSTSTFVVERSKISSFPAFATLNFGGKYLDWTYSDDYTVDKGVSLTIRYCADNDGKYDNTLPSSGNGMKGTWDAMSNSTNGYKIRLNASSWIRSNSGTNGGLCLCGGAGTYVAFPSIEGYVLNKVSVRSGNTTGVYNAAGQCMTTTPDADGNYQILSGCSPVDYAVYGGMDNVWSFNGDTYTGELPISLTMTQPTHPNSGVRIHAIRLYYAEAAAEGRPSVNPLITNVENLEPEVDYPNNKITMYAAFSAVDYSSLSQFTCGFDYKLPSDSDPDPEWSTLTCDTPELEFSAVLSPASRTTVSYRPWVSFVKKDGQVKTVYGEVSQIDMTRIVLNLVFDDPYYASQGGNINYLSKVWGWKSNQNNYQVIEAKGKDHTYQYEMYRKKYDFNFWCLAGEEKYDENDEVILNAETGKPELYSNYYSYALRLISKSDSTNGLSLSYANADGVHAWMQLPGVSGFKLSSITGQLYKKFEIKITDEVDTTSENTNMKGKPIGRILASQPSKETTMTLSLEEPVAGERYYFCSLGNSCTIRNMTLTYVYAEE